MSFNILYIEDEEKDWESVEKAVSEFNRTASGERLYIDRARSPEELKAKLDLKFDAILADVYFPAAGGAPDEDRLDDVIKTVESWRSRQPGDRRLPIIAYTATGEETVRRCLDKRANLYDIWDKNTAYPEYVTWRLSKLAIEIARARPDAKMQQLLREMPRGARWHEDVLEMVQRYDAGWTERDQVERAGKAIGDIADQLGVWEDVEPLWSIMKEWEWLGRAASHKARGHARHVINVFWLGYYLLHAPPLDNIFKKAWRGIVADREAMRPIKDVGAREALSDTWFYAGLFHDVGGCLEKAQSLLERQVELLKPLVTSDVHAPRICDDLLSGLRPLLKDVSDDFPSPMKEALAKVVERGLATGAVDHGLLAAAHFRRSIYRSPHQACFAREAARAVALHNLFPSLGDDSRAVTWDSEPIACLLLLCDQLQTWDRERGDEALRDDDKPYRAELAEIKVSSGRKPTVSMRIDYIAPSHVARSSELFDREYDELEGVLKARPSKALRMIGGSWPFSLEVKCSLSGRGLRTEINLGP